ncbi:XdhC family protein [Anabaena sphaerica FACHB-251]|uniref:XdhC family protein n=1 Tax=Anabaena sphaerica FACHB-251 TaxID=2692883 RepID=A0A926WHE4_9NOST|nr:XdhC/CoxI family protein [Anabaena sphaerica]MBD2294609.1 XdhC family protein [Anabaena sphaerica FACHB-251]
MIEFYQKLAASLQKNAVVLATVINTKGSVPREIGAKMFITIDGKICGTIGGGAGEAKVYKRALQVLETGIKQIVEIDFSGAPHQKTDGICGGIMLVCLELWSGTESLKLVNQIIDVLSLGKSQVLITPLAIYENPYLLADEQLITDIQTTGLIELLEPPPTLLIIGAGHIAVPLAQIAKIAGFQIIIQDDRPEFAHQERFPQASLVLGKPITEIQKHIENISNLYVTLVTRGYQQDLEALRLLCNLKLKYIGMIGSKKRVNTVYKMLPIKSTQFIKSIYAPIGLDIGALTPEEIAVSICAELIKVRRGGTGVSLSDKI